MSTWGQIAHTVMLETLIACEKAGMEREEMAKAIDAAYPFGERARHPYKAWLRVRKTFFAEHGLPRNGDHRGSAERMSDLVAQMAEKRHWAKRSVTSAPTAGANKGDEE